LDKRDGAGDALDLVASDACSDENKARVFANELMLDGEFAGFLFPQLPKALRGRQVQRRGSGVSGTHAANAIPNHRSPCGN
jgi:hypothetical protein